LYGFIKIRRSASFEKEWIEMKVVESDLKAKLNKLYGGTVRVCIYFKEFYFCNGLVESN